MCVKAERENPDADDGKNVRGNDSGEYGRL